MNICLGICANGNKCTRKLKQGSHCHQHANQLPSTTTTDSRRKKGKVVIHTLESNTVKINKEKEKINKEKIEKERIEKEKREKEKREKEKKEHIGAYNKECPICLEEFFQCQTPTIKGNKFVTECQHAFHRDCFLKYAKAECAICRKELKKVPRGFNEAVRAARVKSRAIPRAIPNFIDDDIQIVNILSRLSPAEYAINFLLR